ncbi:restriction endonuclease subunit S [Vibrio lentus]|uniref:Restriction endonuclease subunit S n=1 Tax=Vibrio lentus TaxID=136468 RepID=A0A855IQM7_9VIBR|nr:restriction endonuclease subunit S [Vibrio lentus]PMM58953.1 restriction endonuclease subunit S [Vibrio lentus]
MYKVRVLQEIDDRLDAEYYNPAALSTLKKMENKGTVTTFGSLVNEGYRVVYHGTDSINGLKDSELLPFLSPTQIDPNGAISFDDADKLPLYYKERYPKGLAKVGEILVEVKGNVSKVGIVPLDFPKNLMISGSLYKATLDPKRADSHYVLAFLKSRHGQILKNRLTSNTIINYIAKDALYSIPVIEFGEKAQKYIGDKVRQAEQLRAWAKSVQQQAVELLPAYIREIHRYEAQSYRAKDIVPERLDSLFYYPDYIALERKMKAKGCNRLGLIAKQIKDSWNKKKAETFEYYEIGGLDITTGQVSSTKTQTVGAPSRAKTKVQQGDVLVSTVRPNRKNVGFIVDSVTDSEMVATSGFSVLRFSSLAQAAFYHAWLRSDDATAQLMRWNSGSAYPAIDDDVPLNIIVPEFEQEFVDSWGQKLLDAQFAYVCARKLTEVAKTLVEALIEGQLTEQQLIQAQQALDDGDNSLDKAILGKLSNEGYSIEGATPLFSDIDELSRLMESAAQAEVEA